MKIVLCFPPSPETQRWIDELSTRLPDAHICEWQQNQAFQADFAIVWRAPQAFFDSQTHLKAIFNAGAGVDALQALQLPAGVPLVRLTDAGMGAQMAQYVVHAVLTYFRQFDEYAVHASQAQWRPKAPRRYADYPIGVMGFGALGQAIATALTALGFKVHAWARTPSSRTDITVYAGDQALPAFLANTRVLVCVLPLTAQTRGIVNQSLLAQLQTPAYFINVARGQHVVEADLLEALNNGQLAGATVDVCCEEPAPPDHPFWQQANLTLTPHIAAATLREDSVAQIVGNILAFERGEPMTGIVQQDRGY